MDWPAEVDAASDADDDAEDVEGFSQDEWLHEPAPAQAPTTVAGAAAGTGECHTVFTNAKAGMGGVDAERIRRVVYEMSKSSPFFAEAERKNAATDAKASALEASSARLSPSVLATSARAVDALRRKLDASRVLHRSWVCVDMDAFFASVAELARPELKSLPVAIGGIGMISTTNYVARRSGVRAAMPGFIGRALCPELVFVPPDFEAYSAAAAQARSVFVQYDPRFIASGLDEAFVDLTEHCERTGETPAEAASAMRAAVTVATRGLTCSVGIAPNRTLAKARARERALPALFFCSSHAHAPLTLRSSLRVSSRRSRLTSTSPTGSLSCPQHSTQSSPSHRLSPSASCRASAVWRSASLSPPRAGKRPRAGACCVPRPGCTPSSPRLSSTPFSAARWASGRQSTRAWQLGGRRSPAGLGCPSSEPSPQSAAIPSSLLACARFVPPWRRTWRRRGCAASHLLLSSKPRSLSCGRGRTRFQARAGTRPTMRRCGRRRGACWSPRWRVQFPFHPHCFFFFNDPPILISPQAPGLRVRLLGLRAHHFLERGKGQTTLGFAPSRAPDAAAGEATCGSCGAVIPPGGAVRAPAVSHPCGIRFHCFLSFVGGAKRCVFPHRRSTTIGTRRSVWRRRFGRRTRRRGGRGRPLPVAQAAAAAVVASAPRPSGRRSSSHGRGSRRSSSATRAETKQRVGFGTMGGLRDKR